MRKTITALVIFVAFSAFAIAMAPEATAVELWLNPELSATYSGGTIDYVGVNGAKRHGPVPFGDLKNRPERWVGAIVALADHGVVTGVGDGKFAPDADDSLAAAVARNVRFAASTNASRTNGAEEVEKYWKRANILPQTGTRSPFVDVPEDHWFAPYARWAYDHQVTWDRITTRLLEGVGGDYFGWDGAPLTREATIHGRLAVWAWQNWDGVPERDLHVFFARVGREVDTGRIADWGNMPDWAVVFSKFALAIGAYYPYVDSKGQEFLLPTESVTRAEGALMTYTVWVVVLAEKGKTVYMVDVWIDPYCPPELIKPTPANGGQAWEETDRAWVAPEGTIFWPVGENTPPTTAEEVLRGTKEWEEVNERFD